MPPLDCRRHTSPSEFLPTHAGDWECGWQSADFPFDELIYWWECRLERGEGFRLYLQAAFAGSETSPWLYAGYWGRVKSVAHRAEPEFDHGRLELDQLLLKKKADAWRFRIVSEGERRLSACPALGAIATDNLSAAAPGEPSAPEQDLVLDIPFRTQTDASGYRLKDRCQSAALASAMEYFGTSVPLEQIIAFTTDPEYKSFGIWPRTLAAAHEFGFDAYLDRFRDWNSVRRAVAANKVVLCSIRMPEDDDYIAPPYKSIGGHIVALNGVAEEDRVVVTDSALAAGDAGSRLQWRRPDFEKIWMRNKGGVGMVICPPPGAAQTLVADLPPFPGRKTAPPEG